MEISRQEADLTEEVERGPRARTRRLMLETATRLMQGGVIPSVTAVAEAAEVSRATAYRYFPTQAALVHAVVDEALGPILGWNSPSNDAEERTLDLFRSAMPRIDEFEATFRAALKLSLDQWAARQAGTFGSEQPFTRGHRIGLLRDAIAPLRKSVSEQQFDRLAKALSLLFGIEAFVVLKDIWGADAGETRAVAEWAALTLVRAVATDAGLREVDV